MHSSSSSDDGELLDSCAFKCLLLQKLYVQEYQVHPVNVDRNNFGEYITICIKSSEIIQVDFSDI
jgi:hypothetical protein